MSAGTFEDPLAARADRPRLISPVEESIARWRNNLPEEMFDWRVFLGWWRRPKPNKPGKFDKIPGYATGTQRHGKQGGPEDRANLVDFGDMLIAYQRSRFDGIGAAVLPDVPFWAKDLDNCIADDGTLSALAGRVVACGTYVERSPSGGGLRALFAGKFGCNSKNHAAGVETFDSAGFVTLTGDRIAGEALLPCPDALRIELLEIIRPRRKEPGSALFSQPPAANIALIHEVRLSPQMWRRLFNPYPTGCDRSAVAFSIANQLKRAGLTPEQTLELMANPDLDVLTPALERRGGDLESARAWLWRYTVAPAFRAETCRGG